LPSVNSAPRFAIGLILLFGLSLRFRAADHPYISQWDEAYHALVAKNLVAHPLTPTLYDEKVIPSDDLEWTKAGIWLHKPPLPLWFMSAGIAAFGDGELSFRLPSVILDTGAVLLIFLLSFELFGRRSSLPGLIAAFLYSINPLMIRLVSGRIPDDSPHVINAFFITLTVLLFAVATRRVSRAWAAAAGFSLGLATMCMSAVGLLGLAAALPFMRRVAVKLLPSSLAAFLLAALPWPLYCLSRWPLPYRYESALHINHLLHALDGHAHAWWWYVKILPVQYGGLAVLAGASAAFVLIFSLHHAWHRKDAGLISALAWLLIPYAFFSVIATKLYSYTAVAVPAMCLLTGFALASLWEAREGGRRRIVLAVLAVAGVQAGLVTFERIRADYSIAPWNSVYGYPEFRRVMLKLREVPGPKVLLNVADDKSPQAMYYSGTPSYPDAPTAVLARDLLRRGRRVFVLLQEGKSSKDAAPELDTKEFRGKIFFIPVPAPLFLDGKHPYEA